MENVRAALPLGAPKASLGEGRGIPLPSWAGDFTWNPEEGLGQEYTAPSPVLGGEVGGRGREPSRASHTLVTPHRG